MNDELGADHEADGTAPTSSDTEDIVIRHRQTGGSNAIVAAVAAATLVPFIQALMSKAADSTYEWVRQRLHSVDRVDVSCAEKQLTIRLDGEVPDQALRELTRLDLDALPKPCVLHWDPEGDIWVTTPSG